jgi:hypothetical protein
LTSLSSASAKAQRDAEDAIFAGLSAEQCDKLRDPLIVMRDAFDAASRG